MGVNNLTKKDGSERNIENPPEEVKKHQRQVIDELTPQVYSDFEDFVFGIPGKGQHDALDKFEEYRDSGYQWVANLDVKDCFNSINPKEALPLIDYSFEDIPEISERERLPQGHPLSPLLADVYLNQLDKKIASWVENGCKVIRWRDDIWLMARTKQEAISYAYSLDSFAQELGLDFDMDSRMEVKHVNQGIEILGFAVDRWSKGPSFKNIRRQKERVIHYLNEILMCLRNSEYDSVNELRGKFINRALKWREYFYYETGR